MNCKTSTLPHRAKFSLCNTVNVKLKSQKLAQLKNDSDCKIFGVEFSFIILYTLCVFEAILCMTPWPFVLPSTDFKVCFLQSECFEAVILDR